MGFLLIDPRGHSCHKAEIEQYCSKDCCLGASFRVIVDGRDVPTTWVLQCRGVEGRGDPDSPANERQKEGDDLDDHVVIEAVPSHPSTNHECRLIRSSSGGGGGGGGSSSSICI